MKLAFCLYKYFPYGGLQRDFLRIARECVDRGYQVTAYTLSWEGERPHWLNVIVAPVKAASGPAKYRKFTRWLTEHLHQYPVDAVMGFNKMPGLDIYYCADPCFEHKSRHLRPWWYRLTPRYRHFSRYEQAVFSPGQSAKILMISPVQQALFERYYGTERDRMVMLPPGISRDRCAPDNAAEIREDFRREFDLNDDDLLLLQIGSGFRTKGLDRSLKGLAALPETLRQRSKLFVIGQDDASAYQSQAESLGIGGQVRFFAGRDDVPRFLQGADLLVHPAYAENTGTVLLEAVVAGLPVLVTDVCGYSRYVAEAGAGKVLPSPYTQEAFNCELAEMLLADKSQWRDNGLQFAQSADIYDMPVRAVDVIDQVLERKLETVSG